MATARRDYLTLDSKRYIVASDGKKRSWVRTTAYEPPYLDAPPIMESFAWDSWHMGSGDSRYILPMRTEYGQNTDCRFPGVILPGPAVSTITLTSSVATPTSFFEALGYLWVCAGRYIYRIDPANDAVVNSKDVTASYVWRMGVSWEGVGAATTDETAGGKLWNVTAIGTPDTWAASATTAWLLARETKRLYSVNRTGGVRNIASGVAVTGTWTDPVQAGENNRQPEGLVSFNQSVLVGKPDGFFGFDPDGEAVNIMGEFAQNMHSSNGYNPVVWHNSVLVPWRRGLWRYYQPSYKPAGLEVLPMNRSAVRGRWWDFAAEGMWVYGIMQVGSHTYIKAGREKVPGESVFGPVVWDDLIYLASTTCNAIWVSALWDPPRLFFGHGNNVGYIKLSTDFGAADVWGTDWVFSTAAAGGSRYFPSIDLGRPGLDKSWFKVDIITENCSTTKSWKVYYSLDGATRVQLRQEITHDGKHSLYFKNVTGKRLQLSFDWLNDSTTTPPRITYVEVFGSVIPSTIPVIKTMLVLKSQGTDRVNLRESAETQRQNLENLVERAPVAVSDIYGKTWTGRVLKCTAVESRENWPDDAEDAVELMLHVISEEE